MNVSGMNYCFMLKSHGRIERTHFMFYISVSYPLRMLSDKLSKYVFNINEF